MKTYRLHLISGWSEGPWHFRQFDASLPANICLTCDSNKADIVVAHSSGCFSLPKAPVNQITVLIDPPYWPGKSIIRRVLRHTLADAPKQIRRYGVIFWLKLRFWNVVYAAMNPSRHIKVWRSIHRALELSAEHKKGLLIYNSDDAYCSAEIKNIAKNLEQIEFIKLDGLHEDCWAFAERYIKEIEKELRGSANY